jgi:CheY-like chemotaxis protein
MRELFVPTAQGVKWLPSASNIPKDIRFEDVVADALEPRQNSKQDKTLERRILVVDDNKSARTSLAYLLTIMGYSVCTASDSTSALEVAKTFRPQLAIIDIIMPGVSGFGTAELLRKQEGLRDITIVTVTSWQEEIDDWLSKNAGCNYHLHKPLDLARLETILQQHLPL